MVDNYYHYLNKEDLVEILKLKEIYYIGHHAKKDIINNQRYLENEIQGKSFCEGEFTFNKFDHIGFRYEILEVLGKGSFG